MNIYDQLKEMGFSMASRLIRDSYDGSKGSHTHRISLLLGGKEMCIDFVSPCQCRKHLATGNRPFIPLYGKLTNGQKASNLKTVPKKPELKYVVCTLSYNARMATISRSFEDFCHKTGRLPSPKLRIYYLYCIECKKGLESIGANLDSLKELVS